MRLRVDNSQLVRGQTSTKFYGVRRGTFEMPGSSAIRPLEGFQTGSINQWISQSVTQEVR